MVAVQAWRFKDEPRGFPKINVLVAVIDAALTWRRLEGIRLETAAVSRMALGKDGQIELRLQNPTRQARTLRLALPVPSEFSTPYDELTVVLPEGSEWSKFAWACRPGKRGNFSLGPAHIRLCFFSVAGEHPGSQLRQLRTKFRRISASDQLSFLRSPPWSRDRFALASPSHRRCGSAFTRTLIASWPRTHATINRATACCAV